MLIAHLSDPHITTGPLAADPATGLYRALGRVLTLEPWPDCVVITGDLTDRGQPAEYAALREVIGRFRLPVHLVAGNHDLTANLVAEFGGGKVGAGARVGGGPERASYSVDYDEATIVVLDSQVDGTAAGTLGADQLSFLDSELARRPELPALVCLHHPPIDVGIPFMDGIRLTDGPDLAEVIGRHRNVVRVLAGHLHRTVSANFAGSTLSVAPSTYRQIDLCTRAEAPFGYVHEPTGFLLHDLTGDTCVTHLVQVSHAAAPVQGY
ncbi:3',5'-cyclic adenosine monophosphate phosphodiesterase CpdA [Actinocatenispora thailandica]|uniref:3',5'-cyclic adenosine monophosphate phosphodiesterase CpdA n=1 Tax=Actinocatenispora thailandica TaxID=227318 RepID=A0A7R7I1S3_9ACTN|nr:phosphodiesterase [Actinocatenispora thailandica]BCJ39338.1 3',5'-cyclic adenosine monophosphate phosphodiesterase CpdA [Actinocatenispora thailandica]